MRRSRFRNSVEGIPSRSRALIPVAVVCGALWVSAVFIAGRELQGSAVIPLGIAGIAMTVVLLLALQGQHTRLRSLAATDPLTGLGNHRGFHEGLAGELARAGELGEPVALVMLDLDDFKAVNDTHGHPYGDRILREVGAALRLAMRSGDIATRLGGEEFALIIPGADTGTAFTIAERARAGVAAIHVEDFQLTCSAGIAAFPADAEDAATLCQLADSALYWAKRGGKRRTRRFDPEHSPATWTDRQRTEVLDLLRMDDPVIPMFQPVVSLASGRVVGYEALSRFPDSTRRSPDVWFAQAHGCGLGAELEAAAIRAALACDGRPPGTLLAVNVSPSALSTDLVRAALRGRLDTIIIEITEHEFVPDDESLSAAVADLRARGAMIAIDDAGAGHAGLKQLMRMRPDIVKLDRALICDIHTDPARMALVESFVRFARDVGATVCAEGIERLEELAVLAELDVEWGQGYVLAKPAPPWTDVSPIAVDLCRAALAETFRSMPAEHHPTGSSDRRMVHVSARLASARTPADLEMALALIAAELDASKICLSAWHPRAAILETLAESGEKSQDAIFAIGDYPLSARVLREQAAVQVVVGDPDADPSQVELLLSLGERSMLMVPVVSRGESVGIVEAYRGDDRPWTRAEINRARVIANQLASVVSALATTWDRGFGDAVPLRASGERETRA